MFLLLQVLLFECIRLIRMNIVGFCFGLCCGIVFAMGLFGAFSVLDLRRSPADIHIIFER